MLMPLEAGPEREWSESALVIASRLIQPSAAAYWSALHYWTMTEQVPLTVSDEIPSRASDSWLTI